LRYYSVGQPTLAGPTPTWSAVPVARGRLAAAYPRGLGLQYVRRSAEIIEYDLKAAPLYLYLYRDTFFNHNGSA